jgi:hypothetical protein
MAETEKPAKQAKTGSRDARLAAALRENLRRRKAQEKERERARVRARGEGEAAAGGKPGPERIAEDTGACGKGRLSPQLPGDKW